MKNSKSQRLKITQELKTNKKLLQKKRKEAKERMKIWLELPLDSWTDERKKHIQTES